MVRNSRILAWKIPWMEEPGGLQFMGSWRVEHHWLTDTTHTHTDRQIWISIEISIYLSTSISLSIYSPWGHKESDTTEWLTHAIHSQYLSIYLSIHLYISVSLPTVHGVSDSDTTELPTPSLHFQCDLSLQHGGTSRYRKNDQLALGCSQCEAKSPVFASLLGTRSCILHLSFVFLTF